MKTECTPTQLEFHALGTRDIVAATDGENITSDAGVLNTGPLGVVSPVDTL